MKHIIGLDAKRIVRNATGLGSYGRTLVNDLLRTAADDYLFRLYAPDEGREDLRQQVLQHPNLSFCYPQNVSGSKIQDSNIKGDSSLFTPFPSRARLPVAFHFSLFTFSPNSLLM